MNDYHEGYGQPSMGHMPPPYGYVPVIKLKRKWIACLFSLFIPGMGHMYLGLLQRGFFFMCLLACNISLIPLLINQGINNAAVITLVSLFIPITYFYNLFDALQSTDRVNHILLSGGTISEASQQLTSSGNLGFLFIGVGGWFFLLSVKPAWLTAIINGLGTYIGGLILVAVGVIMVILNYRKR